MALNIKDPETDRLARELADTTGESITVATKTALAERLRRVRTELDRDERFALLDRIIADGRARRVVDARSADEIIGYDEHGLPA